MGLIELKKKPYREALRRITTIYTRTLEGDVSDTHILKRELSDLWGELTEAQREELGNVTESLYEELEGIPSRSEICRSCLKIRKTRTFMNGQHEFG